MINKSEQFPWHHAVFTEADLSEINRVLKSGCLAAGPENDLFEDEFAKFVGRKYAIAVSSGTAALHLILMALNFPKGSEIVVPSFTFIAPVNAIVLSRLTPVFAEVDPKTFTISPESVRHAITSKTVAILGVDLFGNIADWCNLHKIAPDHIFIEDACQALSSKSNDKQAGQFGFVSAFSFFPNKLLTTGEGGMVVTDDEAIAVKIKRLRSQGRLLDDPAGVHSLIGHNFRMTELQAVIGRLQLKRLSTTYKSRQIIAELYSSCMRDKPIRFQQLLSLDPDRGWFCFPLLLDDTINVNQLIKHASSMGIPLKRTYIPVHRQPAYHGLFQPRELLTITDTLGMRIVSLPILTHVPERMIRHNIDVLIELSENNAK